jgi:DNA-binding winged helix-turn-helix (wHTH) protein
VALIRAAPNLVSVDELMHQVWPNLVVSPETVSKRVMLLRDALDEDSRSPRYITSLRGRGYRIWASVSELANVMPESMDPLGDSKTKARRMRQAGMKEAPWSWRTGSYDLRVTGKTAKSVSPAGITYTLDNQELTVNYLGIC